MSLGLLLRRYRVSVSDMSAFKIDIYQEYVLGLDQKSFGGSFFTRVLEYLEIQIS